MPANVESMFYVGEMPWHKFGYRFAEPPQSIEEAITAAGLDWEVQLERLSLEGYGKVPYNAVTRQPNGKKEILGFVGMRYQPLQNIDAFKVYQPLIDLGVQFESAMSLHGGRRVSLAGKVGADILGKDELVRYIHLSHTHDGSGSVNFGQTYVRPICANTDAMARTDSRSRYLKFRHTKNVKEALNAAAASLDVVDGVFNATLEQYRAMAAASVSSKALGLYVRRINGVSDDTPDDKISTRKKNIMEEILRLHEEAPGQEGIAGTWWGAYNAFTYYLSHIAARNEENRYNSLWWGANKARNEKALAGALIMAGIQKVAKRRDLSLFANPV